MVVAEVGANEKANIANNIKDENEKDCQVRQKDWQLNKDVKETKGSKFELDEDFKLEGEEQYSLIVKLD